MYVLLMIYKKKKKFNRSNYSEDDKRPLPRDMNKKVIRRKDYERTYCS